jgi:hypothetical protein
MSMFNDAGLVDTTGDATIDIEWANVGEFMNVTPVPTRRTNITATIDMMTKF